MRIRTGANVMERINTGNKCLSLNLWSYFLTKGTHSSFNKPRRIMCEQTSGYLKTFRATVKMVTLAQSHVNVDTKMKNRTMTGKFEKICVGYQRIKTVRMDRCHDRIPARSSDTHLAGSVNRNASCSCSRNRSRSPGKLLMQVHDRLIEETKNKDILAQELNSLRQHVQEFSIRLDFILKCK